MKLKDMIALYRAQSCDTADPPLCGPELLTLHANEAQVEACRRSHLLLDSDGSMCNLQVTAGQRSAPLAPGVLSIQRAFMGEQPLVSVTADWMDANFPGWQADGRLGTTLYLVSGLNSGKLHLYPLPQHDGNIALTVSRMPVLLEGDDSIPEIREELHPALVDWMLYRVYSSQDTDLYNDAKAAIALRRFEAEFGRKTSGRNEQWQRVAQSMPGPIA